MKTSIRTKLSFSICIPIAAIYLIVLYAEYRIRSQEAFASMQSYLKEVTECEALEIDVKLSSIAQLCRTSSEIISHYHPDNVEDNISLLRNIISSNDDIHGMAFAYEPFTIVKDRKFFSPYFCRNESGEELKFVDSSLDNYNYTAEKWYSLAKEGKSVWTEPYYDHALGKVLTCTYSVPIFIDGKFTGVSEADLSLSKFSEEVDEMKTVGGYCTIISRTGRIISHPEKSYIMNETVFSLAEKYKNRDFEEAGEKMIAGQSGFVRYHDFNTGRMKWIVFSPIKSSGWSFAAIIFEDTVMEPIYSHIKRNLGYFLVALVIIAIIIFIMSSRITRPIKLLAEAVDRLGKGDLETKVTGLKNTDEIGVLARAYNKMLENLKENIDSRIREETARKSVEAELNVAREIQLSLLPRKFPPFPDRHEFNLHALNLPAKFMAGDFFDFFMLDENILMFVIADVSGKGVPAAMLMAVTRTMLRDVSLSLKSPAAVIKYVSDLILQDNDTLMFVTIFYGHYNISTGELCYVNAGHNPPYLIRKNGKMEEIESTGPLAAAFPDAIYTERTVCINPDDTLVCFTDGVTEAYTGNGELYGEDRFMKLLSGVYSEDVEKINTRISDEVMKYSNGDLKDDVTLLTLRRKTV
jgi:sigma-B regulation protein RsbU (phosphoserine phosphatase)